MKSTLLEKQRVVLAVQEAIGQCLRKHDSRIVVVLMEDFRNVNFLLPLVNAAIDFGKKFDDIFPVD